MNFIEQVIFDSRVYSLLDILIAVFKGNLLSFLIIVVLFGICWRLAKTEKKLKVVSRILLFFVVSKVLYICFQSDSVISMANARDECFSENSKRCHFFLSRIEHIGRNQFGHNTWKTDKFSDGIVNSSRVSTNISKKYIDALQEGDCIYSIHYLFDEWDDNAFSKGQYIFYVGKVSCDLIDPLKYEYEKIKEEVRQRI